MSVPHLHLHPDAANGIARTIENQERTIMRLTEENDRLEEANVAFEVRAALRFALLEKRVATLEKQLAEVGRVADRSAQLLTVTMERVDGIAARETI